MYIVCIDLSVYQIEDSVCHFPSIAGYRFLLHAHIFSVLKY